MALQVVLFEKQEDKDFVLFLSFIWPLFITVESNGNGRDLQQ